MKRTGTLEPGQRTTAMAGNRKLAANQHGRLVKRAGEGALVEVRSVVDGIRCAIEIQTVMREREAGRLA